MNRSEMKNLVTATLARHLNVLEQRITPDSNLYDDLGADSLDTVELVLEFEEMFHVEIPDDDVEQIATVGNIIDLLLGKVNSMSEENIENPELDPKPPVVDEDEPELPVEDNDDEANEPDLEDPEED